MLSRLDCASLVCLSLPDVLSLTLRDPFYLLGAQTGAVRNGAERRQKRGERREITAVSGCICFNYLVPPCLPYSSIPLSLVPSFLPFFFHSFLLLPSLPSFHLLFFLFSLSVSSVVLSPFSPCHRSPNWAVAKTVHIPTTIQFAPSFQLGLPLSPASEDGALPLFCSFFSKIYSQRVPARACPTPALSCPYVRGSSGLPSRPIPCHEPICQHNADNRAGAHANAILRIQVQSLPEPTTKFIWNKITTSRTVAVVTFLLCTRVCPRGRVFLYLARRAALSISSRFTTLACYPIPIPRSRLLSLEPVRVPCQQSKFTARAGRSQTRGASFRPHTTFTAAHPNSRLPFLKSVTIRVP